MNDITIMADEIDVEVIRIHNWFKNHRRKDWINGLLCRRCRFFRSPLNEQQHVRATYARPCLRYFSDMAEENSQRAQTPVTPSTTSDTSFASTSDQPNVPPPFTPAPIMPQSGAISIATPVPCHYQPQMSFQETPREVNRYQDYYYAHHYGHVYAAHYGGHEGVNYYSEDVCPMTQSWCWNGGALMSCAPQYPHEWQWNNTTGLLQSPSAEEAYPPEAGNWS